MTDYTASPLISEEAEPLIHLIGNEYQLGWRSVWLHTPDEAVRVEYRNSRLVLTVVRKEKQHDSEQPSPEHSEGIKQTDEQYGTMGEGVPIGLSLPEEG